MLLLLLLLFVAANPVLKQGPLRASVASQQ